MYCACGSLFSPRVTLEIQQEQEQEQEQEIGCLMVMADPSDLGHGKNMQEECDELFERLLFLYSFK